MKNNLIIKTILLNFFFLSLGLKGLAQQTFTDITESSGINHEYQVYEGTFGGGVTVFDVNNDGYEDLYITSGIKSDRLYLNNGNGTFKDIFEGSGLEVTNEYVTQGIVSADVNKDGFRDLFINNYRW